MPSRGWQRNDEECISAPRTRFSSAATTASSRVASDAARSRACASPSLDGDAPARTLVRKQQRPGDDSWRQQVPRPAPTSDHPCHPVQCLERLTVILIPGHRPQSPDSDIHVHAVTCCHADRCLGTTRYSGNSISINYGMQNHPMRHLHFRIPHSFLMQPECCHVRLSRIGRLISHHRYVTLDLREPRNAT